MNVLVRNSQYLNNIVGRGHRAIKGWCRPILGFKSYRTVAVTLAGIELAHRIRKRQFKFGRGRRRSPSAAPRFRERIPGGRAWIIAD
jgi:transposase-like protein